MSFVKKSRLKQLCMLSFSTLSFSQWKSSAFHIPIIKTKPKRHTTTTIFQAVGKGRTDEEENRRSFLHSVSTSTIAAGIFASIDASAPILASAADIKVTPLAHTFITSSGSPKPLRENDATRFLTNAKVVYLFSGRDSDLLPSEVLKLTNTRKIECGPGVTPGQIHVATTNEKVADIASSSNLPSPVVKDLSSSEEIAKLALSLPEGDTLIVGPINSMGVASDGQTISDTAEKLGVFVGGARSGGVLSVLLDGPTQNLDMESKGFPVSTILWYSTKK